MRVVDPDGVEWEVSRRWLELPRWRWLRLRPRDFDPGYGWAGEDLAVVAIGLVAFFVLLFVGLPLLLWVVAIALGIVGLAGRIALGRPWAVEARSERGELAWRVRGLRRSRRALAEIAAALERGDRSFSPRGAERLLPESPLATAGGNVRVLRRSD